MRVLSLFDGIACARIALENLGVEVDRYYASEIDKYALSITRYNYPDIIQLGDIRQITSEQVQGLGIDLVIGGSPCQNLSNIGNREGLAGEKSSLFYEYVRLLDAIKLKNRQVFFLLENVRMKPEYKDIITKLFGVHPIEINSAYFSAQMRKRLYWTNIPQNKESRWEHKNVNMLLRDVIEKDVDKKYELSDIAKRHLLKPANKYLIRSENQKSTCMVAKYGGLTYSCALKIGYFKKDRVGNRVYDVDGKSVCLMSNGGGFATKTGLYKVDDVIRRLTPLECERLQCIPDNYTKIGMEGSSEKLISDTQRYKAIGNGFTVSVIEYLLKSIL